jgi:hypothetical protein
MSQLRRKIRVRVVRRIPGHYRRRLLRRLRAAIGWTALAALVLAFLWYVLNFLTSRTA